MKAERRREPASERGTQQSKGIALSRFLTDAACERVECVRFGAAASHSSVATYSSPFSHTIFAPALTLVVSFVFRVSPFIAHRSSSIVTPPCPRTCFQPRLSTTSDIPAPL